MATVIMKPGADWLPDQLTGIEATKCEEKFDDFLDSSRVCYFKNNGLLYEPSGFKQYTIFLPFSSTIYSPQYHNKMKVFFKAQRSFHKKKPDSVGYLELQKNQFNNLSKSDIGSALFCCYSYQEDDFAIKPLASIRGYLAAVERYMPKGLIEKKKKNKFLIRLTPLITKKIRAMEQSGEPGGYSGRYPKRNTDGTLSLVILGTGGEEFNITHKDYYLVTQN